MIPKHLRRAGCVSSRGSGELAFLHSGFWCSRTPDDTKGPFSSLRGSNGEDSRNPSSDPPPINLVLVVRGNEYLYSNHRIG